MLIDSLSFNVFFLLNKQLKINQENFVQNDITYNSIYFITF